MCFVKWWSWKFWLPSEKSATAHPFSSWVLSCWPEFDLHIMGLALPLSKLSSFTKYTDVVFYRVIADKKVTNEWRQCFTNLGSWIGRLSLFCYYCFSKSFLYYLGLLTAFSLCSVQCHCCVVNLIIWGQKSRQTANSGIRCCLIWTQATLIMVVIRVGLNINCILSIIPTKPAWKVPPNLWI